MAPQSKYKPLRLTDTEIEQPETVLKSFFERAALPELRTAFRQWLEQALPASATGGHLQTANDLERLVEAAWLLYGNGMPDDTIIEEPVTQQTDLPFFDSIYHETFCAVLLCKGEQESVQLHGPADVLHHIKASVNTEQTLVIAASPTATKEMLEQVRITVIYTELRLLSAKSTGGFRAGSPIREAELRIVQNGPAHIDLDVELGSLQAILYGSGAVTLRGTAFNVDLISYGAAPFMARGLQARAVHASISGTADAVVTVAKRLEGNIAGSGRLYYSGRPHLKMLYTTQPSDVIALDEQH